VLKKGVSIMQTLTRQLVVGRRPLCQTTSEFTEISRVGSATTDRPASKKQLNVLVVDDDGDTLDSLSMLVAIWGHTAWVARDGAAALAVAGANQVDVILIDIAMPEMDGYSVARRLRRQPRNKDALLIAITGWGDEAHRLLGNEAGLDLYLTKPVDPSVLELLLALEWARLANSPDVTQTRKLYTSRLSARIAIVGKACDPSEVARNVNGRLFAKINRGPPWLSR
jgi:CheY-like chemotaxis protein